MENPELEQSSDVVNKETTENEVQDAFQEPQFTVNDLIKKSEELLEQSKSIVFQDPQLEALTSNMSDIINIQSRFIAAYAKHIIQLTSYNISFEENLKELPENIRQLLKEELENQKTKNNEILQSISKRKKAV